MRFPGGERHEHKAESPDSWVARPHVLKLVRHRGPLYRPAFREKPVRYHNKWVHYPDNGWSDIVADSHGDAVQLSCRPQARLAHDSQRRGRKYDEYTRR